ncbi:MAG: hypothetical protein ACFFBP_16980 [Promethearchaeota archaeon]
MTVFKAMNPNAEAFGANIIGMIEAMGAFKKRAYDILNDCGIENPKPDQWYNMQQWLNAFKIIYEKLGDSVLKVIGKKIPEKAKLPPNIKTNDDFLPMMDQAYHMNHRGGDVGNYIIKKIRDKEVIVTCTNPYPCAFEHGLLQGFVEKFRAPGGLPSVVHEPGDCRMEGAEVCKYHIKW